MKYIGYVRVSTKHQLYGLESQKERILKYVEENNGELIALFSECRSAANIQKRREEAKKKQQEKNKKKKIITDDGVESKKLRSIEDIVRIELQNALALLRKHKDAILLITALDRLARNTLDFLLIVEYVNKRVFAVDQPYLFNNILVTMSLSGMSEFELELIAGRIKNGLIQARKNGKTLGYPKGKPKSIEAVRAVIETKRLIIQKQNQEIQSIADKNREVIRGNYNILATILKELGIRTIQDTYFNARSLIRRCIICEGY